MKRLLVFVLVALFFAAPALAADFTFKGDLNHRFGYDNQSNFYKNDKLADATIEDGDVTNFAGDIKYRLWTEASTNDGAVKGVYAIELGGIRFGDAAYSKGGGGGYSGDGVNIETRWAYTDFQLPFVQDKSRVQIGLMPFTVNKYLWSETVMGVQLAGTAGAADYKLAWVRGKEFRNTNSSDDFEDYDGYLARADFKFTDQVKEGFFVLYQDGGGSDTAGGTVDVLNYGVKNFGNVDLSLTSLGTDGAFKTPTDFGDFFLNWDLIYQTGSVDSAILTDGTDSLPMDDYDVSAYFAHVDAGVNIGATRVTYTFWYASGDDDDTDTDLDAFMATDVDTFDSIIFMEGGYTDDYYFTERPYIANKGLMFNKLAVDHKFNDKVKAGAALLYLMLAEDITLADGSDEDALGTELDAYVSYMLYPNLEFAINAGYLFADDAMDIFEAASIQDGSSDEDIMRVTSRIRYNF